MSNTVWIFGLGYWANILIAKINEQFKNSPIYVIDPNIKTREVSKFKLFNFSDLETFKEKSKRGDFVFIFTPPSTHFQIAKVALDQMCHVWVEKPLCLEFNQAQELKEEALNNNLTLFIDNTFIYDDSIVAVLKDKNIETSNIEFYLHLNGDARQAFTHLVHADILVTCKSCFSYVAAFLNKSGQILFSEFFDVKIPALNKYEGFFISNTIEGITELEI